ncbi:MAG TPA: DUF488 family protein [Nakamurella sp.]
MQLGRIYDDPHDGTLRVLVDRLWPRGFRRDDPRIGRWLPAVAPSNELRRWYGHDPARFDEFTDRYRRELGGGAEATAFTELADLVAHRDVTLITATREVDRSHLAVLARLLDADPGKP